MLEHHHPIFLSNWATPGCSRINNTETPLAPHRRPDRREPVGRTPEVMKVLLPLTMKWSPSREAVVRRLATSLPLRVGDGERADFAGEEQADLRAARLYNAHRRQPDAVREQASDQTTEPVRASSSTTTMVVAGARRPPMRSGKPRAKTQFPAWR